MNVLKGKLIALELQSALLKLDALLYNKLQKPSEPPVEFLQTWNDYQKIKRYVKLCIIHIANDKWEFDWKWLHDNKILSKYDYDVFTELKDIDKITLQKAPSA